MLWSVVAELKWEAQKSSIRANNGIEKKSNNHGICSSEFLCPIIRAWGTHLMTPHAELLFVSVIRRCTGEQRSLSLSLSLVIKLLGHHGIWWMMSARHGSLHIFSLRRACSGRIGSLLFVYIHRSPSSVTLNVSAAATVLNRKWDFENGVNWSEKRVTSIRVTRKGREQPFFSFSHWFAHGKRMHKHYNTYKMNYYDHSTANQRENIQLITLLLSDIRKWAHSIIVSCRHRRRRRYLIVQTRKRKQLPTRCISRWNFLWYIRR